VNSVALIGRLGRDPEIRHTGAGKAVANFSIAVDYGFGDKKTTSWIPIVAWEKTAELVQTYCKKGSQIAVEGRLQERSWQDKEGNKRTVLEVIANRLDFLTKAEKNSNSSQSERTEEFDATPAEDDPPF
jgi:single-strand DNA-binding protein